MRLVAIYIWIVLQFCCCLSQDDNCQCVPVYRCQFSIQTDDAGLLDIRVDRNGCSNLLDVCCPVADIRQASPPAATCGISSLHPLGTRITTDSEAEYAQFPWMAALLGRGRAFICGGSLIHPQAILTAAHCVFRLGPEEVLVRVGEWDSQANTEPLPVQDRAVNKIVVHEQFTPGSLHNDIAVLFLESAVQLKDNVGIICLPDPNEDMDGRDCIASGWGKDAFGSEGKNHGVLKNVELPIVPRDKCLELLQQTRLGNVFRLHTSFLCAGGEEGKDTCRGDGGSPLVCPTQENPAVYEQAGIVSWGIDCGRNVPGAYTNLALFRSWIDLKLLQNGLSTLTIKL